MKIIGVLAAIGALSVAMPAFADDGDEGDGAAEQQVDAAPAGGDSAETVTGPAVVESSQKLIDDGYPEYKHPATGLPADGKDCKDFVHDSYNGAGVEVPPTASFQFESSPAYKRVDESDKVPGDTVWQSREGCGGDPNCGHVGVYTRDDADGNPHGNQQGTSGAKEIEFGKEGQEVRYYRPKTTDELENDIGKQLDEVRGPETTTGQQPDESDDRAAQRQLEGTLHEAIDTPSTGEQEDVPAPAVSGGPDAASGSFGDSQDAASGSSGDSDGASAISGDSDGPSASSGDSDSGGDSGEVASDSSGDSGDSSVSIGSTSWTPVVTPPASSYSAPSPSWGASRALPVETPHVSSGSGRSVVPAR